MENINRPENYEYNSCHRATESKHNEGINKKNEKKKEREKREQYFRNFRPNFFVHSYFFKCETATITTKTIKKRHTQILLLLLLLFLPLLKVRARDFTLDYVCLA